MMAKQGTPSARPASGFMLAASEPNVSFTARKQTSLGTAGMSAEGTQAAKLPMPRVELEPGSRA
jgi:hypothetical protein